MGGAAQAQLEALQALHGPRVGGVLDGVGVGPEGQPAGEVVEHHQVVADHQQDVRHAQRVGLGVDVGAAQARLDVADGLVAEVAHQAAVEAGLIIEARHLEAGLELLDPREGILHLHGAELLVVDDVTDGEAAHLDALAARQADDRVAPPLLAALHGLEQEGPGRVGQLQIGGERGVEVGQHLTGDRNTVVAGLGQLLEALGSHHARVLAVERKTLVFGGGAPPGAPGQASVTIASRRSGRGARGGGQKHGGREHPASWGVHRRRSRDPL